MFRGDNIICGITTTGTGTLTLAATPGPPGGVDFDVFARATGIGFGNSAAILVSYTLNEYTNSTFATVKATEKGVGTLTLGGSSGIANCTLARTTPQTSATSLSAQPATQNIAPGTGISIGTAANTLVFISPSAADSWALSPYFDSSFFNGVGPLATGAVQASATNILTASGTEYFQPFIWPLTMLAKRIVVSLQNVYTGGVSNAYGRLYQINSSGRPGKLLIDFGVLGTAGSSLSAAFNIQSAAHASGFFLTPGNYYVSLLAIFSGGAGSPSLFGGTIIPGPATGADGGTFGNGFGPVPGATATSGNATAPDPANSTGYTLSSFGSAPLASFALKPA